MTQTNDELMPCPFCGGGAVKYRNKKHGGISAGYISESCPAERWSLPLKKWNTRTPNNPASLSPQEPIKDDKYYRDLIQTPTTNFAALREKEALETRLESLPEVVEKAAPSIRKAMREAGLDCPESTINKENDMKTKLDLMVDRFLRWKLPEDFNPDCGIEFDANKYVKMNPHNAVLKPTGTNLFTATQARAMLEYVTDVVVTDGRIGEGVVEAFEKWYEVNALTSSGYLSRKRNADSYTVPLANDYWTVWQAAIAAYEKARPAREAVSEEDLRTGLSLYVWGCGKQVAVATVQYLLAKYDITKKLGAQ